jgi:pyruvate carboxylase subunit B
VLTYAMFPDLGRVFLQERAAGTLQPEPLLPIEARNGAAAARYATNEFNITLHGETYHIRLSASGRASETRRPYFVTVDGVSEEVLLEALNEVEVAGGPSAASEKLAAKPARSGHKPRPTHKGHVTAAMPGTIVEVLVSAGQKVNAGDPMLVIEAMKMENEVQAPVSGTVVGIFAAKGEAVTPDMALLEIEPEA